MRAIFKKNKRLRRIAYFFPIQLFLVVFKKNQLLVFFWLLFIGFITKNLAGKIGVPFLFLSPEYMNHVNFWSYLILGFACGGFIMAFNISSYIMNGFRFPFLATLSRPFFKFCLNNFIIPIIFIITYIICIYRFQVDSELQPITIVLKHIAGFLVGTAGFIAMAITYFGTVNKDIFKMFGLNKDDVTPEYDPSKSDEKISRDWYIETYLSSFTRIKLARGYAHYDKEMLMKVFRQNHYNAAIFEILAILTLLGLGLFRQYPAFEIPAGASLFLLFTMFLMLTSALYSWLRGWSTTVAIIIVILVNYFTHFNINNLACKAYGLNYTTVKAPFNYKVLSKYDHNKKMRKQDFDYTLDILNKWRLKNTYNSLKRHKKPKFVIINTSGGGLRSTLWTFYVMQYADSILHGQLMKHTELITGSSGGMIGAAYMRELYLEYMEDKIKDLYADSFRVNISEDLLNPLAFTIATNDLFFRFQHFKDGKYTYTKDRGYAFEQKLNENTDFVLDKRLRDYKEPEAQAIIPMMILSPTIINDGRKLLISPQPISYMVQNNFQPNMQIHPLYECIEFSRFFAKQNAGNLWFTSALRMNATFPVIMPVTSLPSKPIIQVIDAGMRDNYGLQPTLKFLYAFRNWISSNTSGVVIIQIRDRHKQFPIENKAPQTMLQSLTRPLDSFYGTLFNIEDFNNNQLLEYASLWFDGKVDVIDFQLRNERPDNISLSWHLTKREKRKVLNSIKLPENQQAVEHLKELLQ